MSDLTPDQQRIRDELIADFQSFAEECRRPKTRSEMLDQAREDYERLIGQPCIASFDGDRILIQTPVLRTDRMALDE